MPGVIRQERFSRALSKSFDLKGSAPPLQVLDDVMPVVGLFDPTDVEHHFARDEVLFSCHVSAAAAGAGTYGIITFGVQAGFIAVLEGLIINQSAAGRNFWFGVNDTRTPGGGGTGVAIPLDMRFEQVAVPQLVATYGTSATVTPTNPFALHTCAANVDNIFPVGVVIDEDDNFAVSNQTANEVLYVTMFGYVRRAEVSERR